MVPAAEVGFTRLQPCLVTKSGKPDLVCRDKVINNIGMVLTALSETK